MTKKIIHKSIIRTGIIIFALIGTFSVVHTYRSNHVQASPTTPSYYGIGATFHRTNKTTFMMGGLEWKIIYSDAISGTGYIITSNVIKKYDCPLNRTGLLGIDDVDGCLSKAQSTYQSVLGNASENDEVGKLITGANANAKTLTLMSLADYNVITDNESNIVTLSNEAAGETWLSDTFENGHRLLFWEDGTYKYDSYTHISSVDNTSSAAYTNMNPVLKINLPQNNFISTITSDIISISKKYNHSDIQKDSTISNINTTSGEGPYHFYIYDTNSSGTTGSYEATSAYFSLIPDSANGTAKVTLKDKLPVGDYYFKVKVIDESTNTSLYHTPTDFTKDEYRTKETGVIHVKVEKGTQDPVKVYESDSDRTNDTNDKTSFSIDKTENTITVYPAGTSDISDSEFTYEILSDPSGILTNTPAKGSSGTFTLSHKAGTASVKITKPGGNNYEDASTTIQITATSITDTPVISANDGTNTYTSGTKSNKDIVVTFQKGPNGSTVNKALKLKELSGNTLPSADWYKTSGTESTITAGDTKTLTASSTQTYVCYWLYYDGYLNEGVEFRVDLLKDTLKIKNPQTPSAWLAHNDVITTSGNSFDLTSANHTLDTTKTKLFEQGNTNKTYPLTNVGEGTYTLHLEDAYGNETELDFKVLAALYFVKINTDTKIAKDEIEYDKDGIYRAQAKGSSNTIKYRVSDGNGLLQATDTSGEFKMLKIGTVEVEAYTEDASGTTLSSVKMNVTITKGLQSLTFDDTNLSKRVKKGSVKFFETATGKRTTLNKAGVGGIKYSSSDTSIIDIDPDTGEVTVGHKGTATITAILNDPTSSSYDANYETKTITKTIEVFEGMSVTFTPLDLQAEKTAILNANAGTLVPKENNGSVSYKISTSSDPKNIDASWFKMNGSTIQLAKAVSGSDLSTHVGGNTFKVQVDVKDLDGTVTVDCVITIRDAENDFYFVNANNVTEKITSISEVYGLNKTFQLQTHTSNGGAVSYKLKDSEDNSIVSVATDGTVTILKVGGPVQAEATVQAGSGYAAKTITIPVSITASSQSIAFQKSSNESVKFVKDTTYATPAILKEADGTVSARAITYISETKSICTIDSTGNITMLATGDCKIKAENSDADYVKSTASKTITLYDGMGGSFTQSTIPQAEKASGNSGSPIGSVSVSGGQGNKSYDISSNTQDNSEKDFFSITSAGVISIKKNISASDIATLPQDEDGNYIMKAVFTATDTLNNVVNIKAEIKVKGAELQAEFDTGGTGMITKTYSPNGTFTTEIINNKGNGVPVYRLKTGADIPTDVLKSIDPASGIVTIENAVEGTKYAYLQADIPASGGYSKATIEVPVNITKAEQDFQFKKAVINLQTESSLDLEVTGIMSKQEDGSEMNWSMVSQDQSLVKVNGHLITGTKKEGSTTVSASVKGDRNYKAASATATIHVSSAPAYDFSITVPNAVYGDTVLQGEIFIDEGTGTNKKQKWTSSDESVATIDETTGEITILKAGKTTITCTQTSDGEPSVSADATFVVDPKPISIMIKDATKKVGEVLPSFTAVIDSSDLVGNDIIDQPIFSCKDHTNKPVTNITPKGEYDITGSYATGTYPNYEITVISGTLTVTQDESTQQWYELIGKTSSAVIASDTWVNEAVYVALKKTESDPYNEISLNQKDWDNTHMLVETEGITKSDVYFQRSDTKALATSQNTTIKIDKTKPEIISITGEPIEQDAISKLLNDLTFGSYFRPKDEITIQAKDIQPNGVKDVSGLNEITYEIYEIDAKTGLPNTEVYDEGSVTLDEDNIKFKVDDIGLYRICAIATDHAGNSSTTKCSDINVKEIDVDKDGDGSLDYNDSDKDGCPDLNIVLGTDSKGNKVKLNVAEEGKNYPYMNIDSNGDGKADLNIDTDGDGKPDLNLVILTEKDSQGTSSVWKPKTCVLVDKLKDYSNPIEYCTGTDVKPQINVDTTGNGIPNINIDTDGDFKADFNIDTDDDGEPDLNIGKVHEQWKPEKNDCIKDGFVFDTATDGKPLINIDTNGDGYPDINIDLTGDGKADINIDIDGDGIPDIDIDSSGDGKPDINIDTTGDGNPDKNIIDITEWIPDKIIEGEVPYGTIDLKEIPEIEDNGIIISKPSGGFLPNHAIKVTDISDHIGDDIKKELDKVIGEQEVKKVYEVEYFKDNVTAQPDGTIIMRVPIDPTIENAKVMIEQEDGTFKEVTVKEQDGYYVFETEHIGKVSILGDIKASEPEPIPEPEPSPDPEPTPTPKPNTDPEPQDEPKTEVPNTETPKSSVQGSYTSAIGGAGTGDITNIALYMGIASFSLGILCLVLFHRHRSS